MLPQLESWVRANGTVVQMEGAMSVVQLRPVLENRDRENKVQMFSFGPKNDLEVKTVLLLGETGAGKTRFVNAFINMLFGVGLQDPLRLELQDQMDGVKKASASQTEYTSAYTVYHQEGMTQPYNYMIVDTPGLGDTDGCAKDEVNEQCLRFYLANETWIKHLNCVGIAWKTSEHRLDARKQMILTKIKSLLGFDIKPLTDVLMTFSPHGDSSSLEVIRQSGVEYNQVFHFENGPLYITPPANPTRQKIYRLEWELMVQSFDEFFETLNKRIPVNLKITSRLLLTQLKLEASKKKLQDINSQKSNLSNQLNDIQARMDDLGTEECQIDWNKVNDLDTSTKVILLEDGRHCHYCNRCSKTCNPSCDVDHSSSPTSVGNGPNPDQGQTVSGGSSNFLQDVSAVADVVDSVSVLPGKAGLFSKVASVALRAVVSIFNMIFGNMTTTRSDDKTNAYHATQAGNLCQRCGHKETDHEIRDKILAKDANFEQKMNLLKNMKFEEVMGRKVGLRYQIEKSQNEMEQLDRQTLESFHNSQALEQEVEQLQTGTQSG